MSVQFCMICADNETVQCPVLLAEKYIPHMISETEGNFILVPAISGASLTAVLNLLHDMDSLKKDSLCCLSDANNTSLTSADLLGLLKLFHCAHFMGIAPVAHLISQTIYERYVQGFPPEQIMGSFGPYMPQITPSVLDLVARKRPRLGFDDQLSLCDEAKSEDHSWQLNDDEWVCILASWDDELLSSIVQSSGYLNALVARESLMIASQRQCMCAATPTSPEAQLNTIRRRFEDLIQLAPATNLVLRAYCDIYRILQCEPRVVTFDQIFNTARELLTRLAESAAMEARSLMEISSTTEPILSGPAAATAAAESLLQAWRRARGAAAALAVAGCYAARYHRGPPEAIPWGRAALLDMFREAAVGVARRIALALDGRCPEAGEDCGSAAELRSDTTTAAASAAADSARLFVLDLAETPGTLGRWLSATLPAPGGDGGGGGIGAATRVVIETYDRQVQLRWWECGGRLGERMGVEYVWRQRRLRAPVAHHNDDAELYAVVITSMKFQSYEFLSRGGW